MLRYVVDPAGRLVAIEGPWDEFAAANGAPHLVRDGVLGQSLLTFVSGLEMRTLTSMLLERARRVSAVSLEFRCDSPSERRHLRMDIAALPGGAVAISTFLLGAEPHPHRALLGAETPRTSDLIIVCSWCKRILLPAPGWVEVDHAVDALGLFRETSLPRLSHGICPECRDRLWGK